MNIEKVLIIDDDDLSIFLMKMTIQHINFIKSSDSVTSGWEALKFLDECQDKKPEVILVDLNMPEMDGFEFIEHFEEKYAPTSPGTKIIVVTSSQRESDKTRALSHQTVVGFMNKPLAEDKLKEILQVT